MVVDARKRVLSIRTASDIIDYIDDFRRGQIALPTQTEALRVLVRLGFERWKEQDSAAHAGKATRRDDSLKTPATTLTT